MSKVIIEGIGNNILIVLVAWVFVGFGWLPLIALLVYALLLVAVLVLSDLRGGKSLKQSIRPMFYGIQLREDKDERDVAVTQKATKAAYQSVILVWGLSLALFFLANIFIAEGMLNIGMYTAGIFIISLCFMLVQSTFFISWCYYYKH